MPQPPISSIQMQGGHSSSMEFEKEEQLGKDKQEHLLRLESWGEIYSFCSEYEPPILPPLPPKEPHQPPRPTPPSDSDYSLLDNFRFNDAFLSSQPIAETEIQENLQSGASLFAEIKKQEQHSSHLDSLDLLRNYASGFTKSKGENDHNLGDDTEAGARKLSTEEIMRMAGERFIQCTSQSTDHNRMFMHPYGSAFSGLSIEEMRDVELAHLLLAAAEKVGYQQFERASRLLNRCGWLASDTGNPVQRLVYYFTEALKERIGRETGRITRRIGEREKHNFPPLAMSTNLVFLKYHQEIPFNQVTVFTGIQAILERVETETKIHLIDLQIRSGVQWTAFIQALAERVSLPVQHLKITAIGTIDRQKMEEAGKSLESFANSLDLPFSYEIIFLSDMMNLRKEHFQIEPHEAVVIYCPIILRTMIPRPNCLYNLMGVFKKLNPSMMIVIEVEANHNSPSFFNRFIETLFSYSAYFDCLEDCTDRDNHYRNILEKVFFADGIHNIIAAEGEERFTRNVKMNVWGAFFQRIGMMQLELSESSIYQANLHLKRFACASSCTLENKGKGLIVGWKGTPIQSLSIWKFCSDESNIRRKV